MTKSGGVWVWLGLVVLVLLTGTSCSSTGYVDQVRASWFQSSVIVSDNDGGSGSGVVISVDGGVAKILTAYHVICDSNGNMARVVSVLQGPNIRGGPIDALAVVVKTDSILDLAILETRNVFRTDVQTVVSVEDAWRIAVGAEVTLVGHPYGNIDPEATTGEVVNLDKKFTTLPLPLIQYTALGASGTSGGAVYSVVNGKSVVISIHQRAYSNRIPPQSFGVTVKELAEFVHGR